MVAALNRVAPGAYDEAVKTVAGVVIVVGFVLAFVVGVIHVAFPPNETVEEGSADLFLFVRRPVLKALEALPLVRFRAKPYLPSVGESMVTEVLPTGEKLPVCKMEVKREPVYRGLFWNVGRRISYRLGYLREHDEDWRAVRLCYAVGTERFVAAENTKPAPELAEVSGFVPSHARGVWVEYTDGKADVHSLNGWGNTDPFWRD